MYLVLLLCLCKLLLTPNKALVESCLIADPGEAGGWDVDSEIGNEVLLS